MRENRVRYLDIYKGIGIILVVLGHMETTPYALKLWLNAFHMPMFFVAAGLLIGENRLYQRESISIVRGRARSILIPYFWFSLIAVLWDAVKGLLTQNPGSVSDVMNKMWDSLSFSGCPYSGFCLCFAWG